MGKYVRIYKVKKKNLGWVLIREEVVYDPKKEGKEQLFTKTRK